jgi:hypothetical protein
LKEQLQRRSIVPDTEKPSSSSPASAGQSPRKRSTRQKPSAPRRRAPRRKAARPRSSNALQTLLSRLSRQAARTGKQIASMSEGGVSSARRTLGKAESASKKAIQGLTREWKRLDNRRRAQFVAALLGALAAASAPLVRSQLKKR